MQIETILLLPSQFYAFFPFLPSLSPLPDALAKTSTTMVNRSGESESFFVLFLILEKNFQPFTTEYDVAVGLSYMTFPILKYIPPKPNFLEVFIKGCCILSDAFFLCLLRQPYDFYLSFYQCDVPHLFIYIC